MPCPGLGSQHEAGVQRTTIASHTDPFHYTWSDRPFRCSLIRSSIDRSTSVHFRDDTLKTETRKLKPKLLISFAREKISFTKNPNSIRPIRRTTHFRFYDRRSCYHFFFFFFFAKEMLHFLIIIYMESGFVGVVFRIVSFHLVCCQCYFETAIAIARVAQWKIKHDFRLNWRNANCNKVSSSISLKILSALLRFNVFRWTFDRYTEFIVNAWRWTPSSREMTIVPLPRIFVLEFARKPTDTRSVVTWFFTNFSFMLLLFMFLRQS